MDRVLKNIINKSIEREYSNSTNNFTRALQKNVNMMNDYDETSKRVSEITNSLEKVISDEHKDMIEELVNLAMQVSAIEAQVMFKEGVVLGATSLKYLGDVGMELQNI